MGSKDNNASTGFMPYERPVQLGKWEEFRLYIWNPKEKAILGRNAKSWGGIVLFYLIFYAVLAALFAVCMQGLFYVLDDHVPRWQLDSSLIGNNPGLGFRPISEDVEHTGSMITYVASDNASVLAWTKRIDAFLKPYGDKYDNQVVCDFSTTLSPGKVCEVKVNTFGKCTHENDYGYRNSAPCFFVKLNKIIGWQPEPYEKLEDLPDDMPDDLKTHIKNLPAQERKVVWVTCKGENPADRENIGDLEFWPNQGFAAYYYPYMNTDNYMSPLVAVQLKRPVRHVLINIECRAWAHNVRYAKIKNEREGSVHLEVMVD